MTLKDILKGKNYEIKANHWAQNHISTSVGLWADIAESNKVQVFQSPYQFVINKNDEIIVLDTDSNQKILKIRSTRLYIGDQQQKIEKSVIIHMFVELAIMYYKQEQEKERIKAEEEAAKFEQKKNAVYQNLFNIINPRKM